MKRGMSAIIVTLLLVMLSVILAGVVWSVINSIIHKQISSSSSCYDNFNNGVTINEKYTCYNTLTSQVRLSLNVGDVDITGISVGISGQTDSKGFVITNQSSQIDGLKNYTGGALTRIPGKNAGQTYFYAWSSSKVPTSIDISPVVGQTTCPISDSISSLSSCA